MININYYIPSDDKAVSTVALPIATTTVEGAIRLGDDTVRLDNTLSPTTAANRTYPIQLNQDKQAVVNVPWESGQNYVGEGNLNINAKNGDTITNVQSFNANASTGTSFDVTFANGDNITLIPDSVNNKVTISHNTVESTAAVSTDSLKKITTDGKGHIISTANVSDSDITTNDRYVRFDINNQSLTDTQKSNTRTNIGAGTGDGSVTNIGAGTGLQTNQTGNADITTTGNISLKPASTSEIGGIKVISTRIPETAILGGADYGVERDSNNQGLVHIPWEQVITSGESTANNGTITVNGFEVGIHGWATKANVNSPVLTGTPTAPTAASGTSTDQIATTEFVMNAFRANDAMIFKGTIGAAVDNPTVTSLPNVFNTGWTYKVITAGTYTGHTCQVGDMIVAVVDRSSGTTSSADWSVIQTNLDGYVTSSSNSSTDNHIVVFDGTSGHIIKDGTYTIGKSVPSNALFTDTWQPNAFDKEGYVAAPTLRDANKVWRTDASSNPGWGNVVTGIRGKNELRYRTGDVTISENDLGLKDVVRGLPDGVTTGHIVTWGSDGLHIADSGFTIGTSIPSGAIFTDTASAVDNILDGSNSGTAITYAPYASATATSIWVADNNNAGKLYFGTQDPSKTTRLNYNGHLHATKLYSGTQEVKVVQTAISDPVAGPTGTINFIDSITQDTNGVITATKKPVQSASASDFGVVKVGAVRGSTINVTTGGIISSRYYGVELDNTGKAFVNVPWANDTYSAATSNALGLIKVGYVSSDPNYAVVLDGNNNAYVQISPAALNSNGTLVVAGTQKSDTYINVHDCTTVPIYNNMGKCYDENGTEVQNVPAIHHAINVYDIIAAMRADAGLVDAFKQILNL